MGVAGDAPRTRSYSGEVAKKVFQELELGKNSIEIVMSLSVHPDTVEAIEATWYRLKGCIYLSRDIKLAIEQLPLQGELPILDGPHLLKVLQRSLNAAPCARCGVFKARFCTSCVTGEVPNPSPLSPAKEAGLNGAGSL